MNKEKALKNQGLEFREDIGDQGGTYKVSQNTASMIPFVRICPKTNC